MQVGRVGWQHMWGAYNDIHGRPVMLGIGRGFQGGGEAGTATILAGQSSAGSLLGCAVHIDCRSVGGGARL